MNYFIGIDIASQKHSVFIMNDKGDKVKTFEITNDFDGYQELGAEINKYKNICVCCEGMASPINGFLENLPIPFFKVNPLKIKRFKEILKSSGDKNDLIDAIAIASFVKTHYKVLHPVEKKSDQMKALDLLRIHHDRLSKERTRFTNKLIFVLKQYFPLYVNLFSSSAPKILLSLLLAYPTWANLKNINEDELREFLINHNYRVPKNIKKVIDKIKSYKHTSSGIIDDVQSQNAIVLVKMLLNLREGILQIEKAFTKDIESHPLGKVFNSLPGAGIVLSAKMLALFGDNRDRFNKAIEIQSLFGTAPINYQSGSYHKVRMRRACKKKARATLYQFAFASLQHSSWARAYYDGQRAKGKTHSVAIRALSNKWMKIIFHMWKDDAVYCPERLTAERTELKLKSERKQKVA